MRLALIALLVVGGGTAPTATADTLTHEQKQECQFNSMNKQMEWTEREEARTTFCVLRKWPVPGGISKFRAVGQCESGWYRFAIGGGQYLGLFQHDKDAWSYRVKAYDPVHWYLQPGWTNSRTQIVVTARMVRAQGWGPWTCA